MQNVLYIINFIGGLALFLYSLKTMSSNLQSVSGKQMKDTLKKFTNTPFKGVLVGTVITGVVQSSSAVSVMIIGLVNAGLMNLSQAIGVIMGANIGTTVTGQLIAFKLTDVSYIFITIGVIFIFLNKKKSFVRWGYVILSFGLLFVSIDVMSNSVSPIKNSPLIGDFLYSLSLRPITAIIFSTFFTMLIQSSSAATGIIIVFAMQGIVDPLGSMYLVYGTEIGTTITAWLASLTSNRIGKRVALFHTLFNVIGVSYIALLTYLGPFQYFINWVSPGNVLFDIINANDTQIARFVANTNMYSKIINVLIFLPFVPHFTKICEKIIKPTESEIVAEGEPRHLDQHLLHSTEMAVEQSIKEMCEMLKLVKRSLELSMNSYINKSYKIQEKIGKIENAIDHLQREITLYLVAVSERSTSRLISRKIPSLLHSINDIEKLGDFAEDVNIILNNQILSQSHEYHHDFDHILVDKHQKILYMIELLLKYLEKSDIDFTKKILEIEDRLKQQHSELRKKILYMIQTTECDANSGINTIDYIDAIEALGNKLKNIALAASRNFVYLPVERPKSDRIIFNIDDRDS